MAVNNPNTDKGVAALAGGAAGAILALVLGKKNSAQTVDDDTETNALLAEIRDALLGLAPPEPGNTIFNAVTPSYRTIRPVRVAITAANINQPINLPTYAVPAGVPLKIKAGFSNVGVIYVGGSAADSVNPNQSEPLTANEFGTYYVNDAEHIWISGAVVGDFVTLIAEVP